jgi:Tol biopolymer transport system component
VEKRARLLWVLAVLAVVVVAGCSKGTNDVTGPAGFDEGGALLGKKPPPPPANPEIAYVVSNRKGDKLMVMNADGTNQVTIFQGDRNTYGPTRPSWSPDGGAIAFLYDWKLYTVPVIMEGGVPHGGEATCLSEETIYGAVEWSPGGPKAGNILYVDSGNRDLVVISADGGAPEVLYHRVGIGIDCPVWSADGNQVAFLESDVVDGAPEWTLRILDVETETVIHSDILEGLPAANRMCMDWARTRDQLIYGTGLPGEGMIYTINISTGALAPETEGWVPGWSPDDTKLVYQTTRLYIGTYDLGSGQTELLTGGDWPDWKR